MLPILAAGLASCGPQVHKDYRGPGWYLERSNIISPAAPRMYGGPYSYEKCEEERIKLGPTISPEMLCINHPGPPRSPGL